MSRSRSPRLIESRQTAAFVGLLVALCLPRGLPAAQVETIDGVPHVRNGAEPTDGERTVRLEELWHFDVEDEEILIGVISDVLSGPDGTIWLADRQLSQVLVYSATGEYVQTLSGEGEGPGEVRDPDDLLWFPDGSLGILDRKSGQITRLDHEGRPLSSVHLKLADGESLTSADLREAQCGGGTVAVCGTEFRFGSDAATQNRFFGIYDREGGEVCRLLEAPSGFDFGSRSYDEPKDYFVDRGAWAVDHSGRIHFAPERNRHAIHVCDAQGRLVRVYEREQELWRRSAEEKEAVASGASMSINGEVVKIDTRVDDHAPAIVSVEVAADGRIWVLSSRGTREQPEGVFRSYDVFDPEGDFREVVHLVVELDEDDDRLHRLADGRWIILRNISSAIASMYASYREDDTDELLEEDGSLEIVCLRAVPQ